MRKSTPRFALRFTLATLAVLSLLWPMPIAAAPPLQAPGPAAVPAGPSPQAGQGAQWFDGGIQYSQIVNCWSVIQAMPYYEQGIGTYVGFYGNPQAPSPVPNTPYLLHVVAYGLGNSCAGQYAYIEVALPQNTSFAISPANPIRCYGKNGALPSNECPQAPVASGWNAGYYAFLYPYQQSGAWPLAQGSFIEMQIPVVSSSQLSGAQFQANVWALDGNSSPWLHATQGVYVFGSTPPAPSISYPSPSTVVTTTRDLLSTAYLYTYNTGGTFTFEAAPSAGGTVWSESGTVAAGQQYWLAWENWLDAGGNPVLLPNTDYRWRLTYAPSGGSIVYGAYQTFRTAADGRVTVGNGTSTSCTEPAFYAVLNTAREVNFSCGPVPVTITLAATTYSVFTGVNLNGANKVTIAATDPRGTFYIHAGGHLTLTDITIANGVNDLVCGGAVHVYDGGTLSTSRARFLNNRSSGRGGALCVDPGGYAGLADSLFSGNQAGTGGGAIYNASVVEMWRSDISGNSTAGNGGGVWNDNQFWTTGTTIAGNSANNGSTSRGGGIYDTMYATLHNSTVSGNFANYGGGVSTTGLGMALTSVTIADNAGDPGGSGPGRFMGAGGLESTNSLGPAVLRNVLLARNWPGNCATSFTAKYWTSSASNLDTFNRCGFAGITDRVNVGEGSGLGLTGLANYGGSTRTQALMQGSAAIDAGTDAYCSFYDQRGYMGPNDLRAVDGNGDRVARCDIGAFEYRPTLLLPLVLR